MPPPGEIELRESSSPVPAQTIVVSLGAIARAPIETTRWLSNTGRKVVPALVVFQIPPVEAATKNVRDGLGIPAMSVTRPPMLAGPTGRQRKPARRVESSGAVVWAARGRGDGSAVVSARTARTARTARGRGDMMTASDLSWKVPTAYR